MDQSRLQRHGGTISSFGGGMKDKRGFHKKKDTHDGLRDFDINPIMDVIESARSATVEISSRRKL